MKKIASSDVGKSLGKAAATSVSSFAGDILAGKKLKDENYILKEDLKQANNDTVHRMHIQHARLNVALSDLDDASSKNDEEDA